MRRSLFCFLGSALVFAAVPTLAAKSYRLPSAGCTPYNGTTSYTNDWHFYGGSPHGFGIGSSTTSVLGVMCGFPERDLFRKDEVATINVHAYDGSTVDRVWTAAVWWSASANSVSQSAVVYNSPNSDTGFVTLSPSPSVWNTQSGFAGIWVDLPGYCGTCNRSTFKGWFVSET
jgi:hypothetical protein